jgi:hypothetical protein
MTGKYLLNNTNSNQAKAVEPAQPGHRPCPLQGGRSPTRSEGSTGVCYFNQPRRRKYHIGTRALAVIMARA